jgi:uncharacterized protein YcnI
MKPIVLAFVVIAALAWVGAASAHAHVSPDLAVAGHSELYSLAVPTEKEGATTTKIVLTVPSGFSIDSFVASPRWQRTVQQTGSGEEAVVQGVTWSGGSTPTGEDSLFQFLGAPANPGTYTFRVQQTYSDGSVVDWSGPESSETPAATIEAKSSLGGGSSNTLAIVALIVGAAGVVLGGLALFARSGRQLA